MHHWSETSRARLSVSMRKSWARRRRFHMDNLDGLIERLDQINGEIQRRLKQYGLA